MPIVITRQFSVATITILDSLALNQGEFFEDAKLISSMVCAVGNVLDPPCSWFSPCPNSEVCDTSGGDYGSKSKYDALGHIFSGFFLPSTVLQSGDLFQTIDDDLSPIYMVQSLTFYNLLTVKIVQVLCSSMPKIEAANASVCVDVIEWERHCQLLHKEDVIEPQSTCLHLSGFSQL